MSLFGPEKLTITSHSTEKRKGFSLSSTTFTCYVNPTSVQFFYDVHYNQTPVINGSGVPAAYGFGRNTKLKLGMVVDGSGEGQTFILSPKTVMKQVEKFLKLTGKMDGKIHQSRFLNLNYGDIKNFSCRLESVSVDYSGFDRSGRPIRADLDAVFVEDIPAKKRAKQDRKSSPDLTHIHRVQAGENLALISLEYYGEAQHFEQIARHNDLDDLFQLVPGTALVIPPLELREEDQ